MDGFVPVGVAHRRTHSSAILCALVIGVGCEHTPAAARAPGNAPSPSAWVYPPAPRNPVVEEHHGVKVADPFRPLEDLNSSRTVGWVAAENRLTDTYFATISGLPSLRARLAELSSNEKYGLPRHRGERAAQCERNRREPAAHQESPGKAALHGEPVPSRLDAAQRVESQLRARDGLPSPA